MKNLLKSKLTANWLMRDEVEFKIRDMSRKIIYKGRANINNKKQLAEIFSVLKKYGVDLSEINEIIDKKEKKGNDWFFYPLGNKE